MPAIRHLASANALVTVTAIPTTGAVGYILDGQPSPGPNISFPCSANPGTSRKLSITFTGPGGSSCPIAIAFDKQVDHDILFAVDNAPPDVSDHEFITTASAADLTHAANFRAFQLTGKMPNATAKRKTKKAGK